MKRVWASVLLFMSASAVHAADLFKVEPALWDRPRSARAVLEQPAVRQAIELYLSRPGARLILHHGYGQEPVLQAEELRLWLMALAVDGARVSLVNDIKPQESMTIEVVK